MKRIFFLLTIMFIVMPQALKAQQQDEAGQVIVTPNGDTVNPQGIKSVQLLARSYGDSIVLRWAPEDAGLWMAANSYGWNIYRSSSDDSDTMYHINSDGDTVHLWRLNGDTPIKPMSLDEMKRHFDSTDLYAGTAAQALYGVMTYDVNKADQSSDMDFLTLASKQYQEQTQRQFMAYLAAEMRPDIAKALGLMWVDKNVKRGQLYEYTIECLVPQELTEVYGSSVIVPCKNFRPKEDEQMPEVRITQLDPHKVALRWDKNKLSGYFIQRSSDGGRTWENVNDPKTPVWPMLPTPGTAEAFGDSVAHWMQDEVVHFDSLDATLTYTYRVQAFDLFGERRPWRSSQPFKLFDLIPPTEPVLLLVRPEENTRCVINWTVMADDPDLKGFVVTFARDLEGPWNRVSTLLDKTTRQYVDPVAYQRGRGLYRIFAVDTADNVSFSSSMLNFIEDVFPPAAPTGLQGVTDDSTGIVYLRWNEAKDDDFLAYKVYFANQRDHEFIGCTDGYIYQNQFYDTVDISSLTHEIFYYVITVDNNHNYSQPSDTLRILLPDLIPPGHPILDAISQTGDSVTISWLPSVSQDVKHYFIYRKFRDAAQWQVISTLSPRDVQPNGHIILHDAPTPSDKPYTWCIEAIDSAGNSSGLCGQAVAQVLPNPEVKAQISLQAQRNRNSQAVTLSWTYTTEWRKDFYGVVYRSEDDGEYSPIGSFKRQTSTYTDATAPKEKKLKYYIQFQLGGGKYSTPSNIVEIKK